METKTRSLRQRNVLCKQLQRVIKKLTPTETTLSIGELYLKITQN